VQRPAEGSMQQRAGRLVQPLHPAAAAAHPAPVQRPGRSEAALQRAGPARGRTRCSGECRANAAVPSASVGKPSAPDRGRSPSAKSRRSAAGVPAALVSPAARESRGPTVGRAGPGVQARGGSGTELRETARPRSGSHAGHRRLPGRCRRAAASGHSGRPYPRPGIAAGTLPRLLSPRRARAERLAGAGHLPRPRGRRAPAVSRCHAFGPPSPRMHIFAVQSRYLVSVTGGVTGSCDDGRDTLHAAPRRDTTNWPASRACSPEAALPGRPERTGAEGRGRGNGRPRNQDLAGPAGGRAGRG
jgi:hypothetical protein